MHKSRATLPDVLRVLPPDVLNSVLGASFSSSLVASCRLVCRELCDFFDACVTSARLQVGEAQRLQGTSPLARLPRCSRLALRLGTDAGDLARALAGTSAQARQRISSITISRNGPLWRPSHIDLLATVESLGQLTPALEELEFAFCSEASLYRQPQAARQRNAAINVAISVAPFAARLRRLAMPLPCRSLGALGAACLSLRELSLQSLEGRLEYSGSGNRPDPEALSGLLLLARVEELTLHCIHSSDELLPLLLSTHRPPNVRRIRLVQGYMGGLATLQVTYAELEGVATGSVAVARTIAASAPAAAAKGAGQAAGAASSSAHGGIKLVQLEGPSISVEAGEDADRSGPLVFAWAGALLQALRALQQPSLPGLCLNNVNLWTMRSPIVTALVECCERLEVGLVRVHHPEWKDRAYRSRAVPAGNAGCLRRLGLPRVLELWHGEWRLPEENAGLLAGSGGSGGVAAAGAEASVAGGATASAAVSVLRRSQQQRRPEQEALGLLHLDTATPKAVLRAAVDRLWAEVTSRQVAATADAEATDGASGSSSSGGGGDCGDDDEPRGVGLVMLRCCRALPRVPVINLYFYNDTERDWAHAALDWACGEPPEPWKDERQGPLAADGYAGSTSGTAGHERSQKLCYVQHLRKSNGSGSIAAASAGALLIVCASPADAAALVRLQRERAAEARAAAAAAAAAVGPGPASRTRSKLAAASSGNARSAADWEAEVVVVPAAATGVTVACNVMRRHVFQVLMDLWARAWRLEEERGGGSIDGQRGGSGGSGGNGIDDAYGGSGGRDESGSDDEYNESGGSDESGSDDEYGESGGTAVGVVREEVLRRLRRLVWLDAAVRRGWPHVIPACARMRMRNAEARQSGR
ncbi:hypothetical protein HYH02_005919 [Chlamydomonas schloesseri]|uniref:F-box domain-containing protein n=1 Tax=Chlamydomonas schloesseri TaxID=2026947 RepID=A0A835WKB9_9CHLO|nr:hypothetical protein HYH02_005919 [Chlamydomonas schloesseri]|eukprot:KAG2449172.1 hypothetical protein HYH02_005919 [Chlamydomonas schloesseri]